MALLFVAACEVANPEPAEKLPYPSAQIVKTLDNVAYGAATHQVLDVYSPPATNGGAIVWIHGGGWGDDNGSMTGIASEEMSGMQPIVFELYRRGWTIFSIRHAGVDEAVFPQQIYDVKLAIRWIKARAAEFAVSPAAVVTVGWSSGGHLAALAAVSSGSMEPPAMPSDLAAVTSKPAAAVSIAGVLDPLTFALTPGFGNAQGIATLIGCPSTPELWQTCNPPVLNMSRPTTYDDPSDAPIYIAQGDRDGIVDPWSQGLVPYQDLMQTLGNEGVWLDYVDTGENATYGGHDPRNHTKEISYELNAAALYSFIDRFLPTTPIKPSLNRFVPVAPCRLGDTRGNHAFTALTSSSWRVQVTGRCGIPAGARAVAVTITAVGATASGYLAAYPAGSAPGVSLLNFAVGDTRANSGMITLSAAGALDVAGAKNGTPIIVDVTGAFVPTVASVAGRFVPITPARLLDSREGNAPPLAAGTQTTLTVAGAGVPAGASAVAINLTATQATHGFLTAMAAGGSVPASSMLNIDSPGQTRAAFVVVPVSSAGFTIVQSMISHLVVDVVGYFTGPGAAMSRVGLYQPVPSTRSFDSRVSGGAMLPGQVRTIPIASARASAVATNVTLLGTAFGHATVWKAGEPQPSSSSLNADPSGLAVANQALVAVGGGAVQATTAYLAHLIVDVTGWFVAY